MPTQSPPRRPTSRSHPLASVVLALFERFREVDVTMAAMALAGAFIRPAKGNNAYRLVASDVLGYLWHQGVLVQHTSGNGNPRRPEDGGFWYTLAEGE